MPPLVVAVAEIKVDDTTSSTMVDVEWVQSSRPIDNQPIAIGLTPTAATPSSSICTPTTPAPTPSVTTIGVYPRRFWVLFMLSIASMQQGYLWLTWR
jgi:hypothetical protein